jgi:hypothetical protein
MSNGRSKRHHRTSQLGTAAAHGRAWLNAVVSELSQREGVSRRQAQRITAKAHQTLVTDLDQTERTHLTAQLVHLLMESAAQAIKAKNSGAVVGISRELRALVGLGIGAPPERHHPPMGRFGSSSRS